MEAPKKMGSPTRFNTSHGWMSCFDANILGELALAVNRTVSVEVQEKPNARDATKPFYNIINFYGIVAPGLENAEEVDPVEVIKPLDNEFFAKAEEPKKYSKEDAIMVGTSVSYAKDIVCAEIKAGINKGDRSDVKKLSAMFLNLQKELNPQ